MTQPENSFPFLRRVPQIMRRTQPVLCTAARDISTFIKSRCYGNGRRRNARWLPWRPDEERRKIYFSPRGSACVGKIDRILRETFSHFSDGIGVL
ncbi:hypothetical protein TNCV_2896091 [Trichonephila clavipes]|nr:hypothetical protein TNCV_2896091 [Trichonephila clavipes]